MIKLENTDVYGFESAIRGMRNPLNSWNKSDSYFTEHGCSVGENDLKLMKNLSKAGNDHAKFLRMINVTFDLTAPLYFLKEFDTYKVATVSNSCSTMHKIQAKQFTLDDFSHEHLTSGALATLEAIVERLNIARKYYNDKIYAPDFELDYRAYWWDMIQLLPSSYNQKRTVQLNYQVLKSMYFARRQHKLDEWISFCSWMKSLPYFKEVCIDV